MAPTSLKVKEKGSGWPAKNMTEDAENEQISDKDKTEERLEKLLFGDDAGFLEGLKARPGDQQLTVRQHLDEDHTGTREDEDLENLADENVRITPVCQRRGWN
jgi:U3 small nucleolar RNA-associated protein 18